MLAFRHACLSSCLGLGLTPSGEHAVELALDEAEEVTHVGDPCARWSGRPPESADAAVGQVSQGPEHVPFGDTGFIPGAVGHAVVITACAWGGGALEQPELDQVADRARDGG